MTGIDQDPSPESSIAKFECLLQSWNQFLLWDNLRVHYRLGAWRTGGERRAAERPRPLELGQKVKSRPTLDSKTREIDGSYLMLATI
jgi:hypothetical protein